MMSCYLSKYHWQRRIGFTIDSNFSNVHSFSWNEFSKCLAAINANKVCDKGMWVKNTFCSHQATSYQIHHISSPLFFFCSSISKMQRIFTFNGMQKRKTIFSQRHGLKAEKSCLLICICLFSTFVYIFVMSILCVFHAVGLYCLGHIYKPILEFSRVLLIRLKIRFFWILAKFERKSIKTSTNDIFFFFGWRNPTKVLRLPR